MSNKFNKLIIIFILLQSFLDIYAGSNLNYNIHIIIRGLFFISALIYIIKNKTNPKLVLLLTTIMFIYFSSYLIFYKYSIIDTISYTFKLFYLPITTIFFYSYKEKIDNKYITISFILYITLFLICYIFNLGNDVYQEGVNKQGFKGLFNSINEFSAIIIILLPIILNNLSKKKKYIECSITTILVSIVSMLTGTKVMLGGVIITFLYFLYNPFINYFRKNNIYIKILIIIFINLSTILGCFIITNTTAYKNAIVQADFFKVKNIFSLNSINKVVFNDRFSFVGDNHKNYLESNDIEKILGLKYNINRKDVEIDLFDVFYKYGIVGLIIISSIVLYYGYKSKLKNAYLLSYILFLLISETSGHILIYPAVSIYLGVIIYLNKQEEKNKECQNN